MAELPIHNDAVFGEKLVTHLFGDWKTCDGKNIPQRNAQLTIAGVDSIDVRTPPP